MIRATTVLVAAMTSGACTDRAAPVGRDSLPVLAPSVSVLDSVVPGSGAAVACPSTAGDRVTVYGIGSLCAGMTVDDAQAALNEPFSFPANEDPGERILSLYPGQVTSTPHRYTDGTYLTVTPKAPADSAYRLVFEVEAGKVTTYRSGTRPQVEYVERCS